MTLKTMTLRTMTPRLGDTAADKSGSAMSPTMDPEEREIEALRLLGEWGRSRTLEIGSGDGRLFRRLRTLTYPVTGVDCCPGTIAAATAGCRATRLAAADACRLPFRGRSFDQVLFGWSL